MKHEVDGILAGRTVNVESALVASIKLAELVRKYCAEPGAALDRQPFGHVGK